MTINEYFGKFTPDGIKHNIEKDHSENMMAVSYMERVYFVLEIAARDRVLPINPAVDSTKINQILLYALYKLDRAKFYLKEGYRNVNLDSMTLLEIMSVEDHRMRSFANAEIQREYTTVMVCVALLYMLAMCKTVEIQTLLKCSADANKIMLMRTFNTAQEMLNDCRHFSHNGYDTRIMNFLNQSRQTVGVVKHHQRAY